jgi:hypothetical protein
MNYKVLCIISGVLNVVLIANFVNFTQRSNKKISQLEQSAVPDRSLDSLVVAYNNMERTLMEQNAALISENNELKFQIGKKPQIIKIYKNEKNTNVSDDASEFYNGILSRRYEAE